MTELDQKRLVTRIVESLGGNLFPGNRRFWERVDGDLRPQSVKVVEGRIRAWLTEYAVGLKPSQFRMLIAEVRSMLPRLNDGAEDVAHAKMLGLAKQYAERKCSRIERRWLLAGPVGSYQCLNGAELWVLQGSPPKGFILHVHGSHGWVGVYDIGGTQLKLIQPNEV